jgi:Matrixin
MTEQSVSPMKLSRFCQLNPSKDLLGTCCLLSVLSCLSTFSESSSQNTNQDKIQAQTSVHESIMSDLSLLESKLKLNIPNNQPISERIGTLEMIIFGAPQSGSLVERLSRIKKAAPKENQTASIEQEQPVGPAAVSRSFANPLAGKLFQLTPLVNESSVNFVRIENFGTNPNQAGDYYDLVMRATKNKVLRFKQMPIPVYITPFPDPAYTNACVRAFEAWEERASLVSFRQVETPDQARIRVIWSHMGLAQNPHDCSLGAHTLTSWRRLNNGVRIINIGGMPIPLKLNNGTYNVPPQIIEVNLDLINAKPPEVRMRILQNIVAHELGHALGLLGHSSSRSDLMYPVTDEYSRLSQQDIKTLTRLYQAKVDIPL